MSAVFVTGGGSVLGRRVLDLLAAESRVIALQHRRPIPGVPGRVEVVPGSLDEPGTFAAALAGAGVVLHLAALTHAREEAAYEHVNHALTRRLLGACRAGQRFVLVSSLCAHPDGGGYGRSKWQAEEAVRASGLPYSILRPAEIYGSKAGEGIDRLVELARRLQVLVDFRGPAPVRYSPISLEEAAQAIARAVLYPVRERETYVLCNNRTWTAREMAPALREVVRPLLVLPIPLGLLLRLTDAGLPMPFQRDQIDRLLLEKDWDNAAACRDFGFRPRPFTEHLAAPP